MLNRARKDFMTLSVKSNNTGKELVELSVFEKKKANGTGTTIEYCARWAKITVNTSVNLPGGQTMTKIAQLPTGYSHPAANMGVFPLMNEAWMPTANTAYVKLESDGGIYARSMNKCTGTLYFDWPTNDITISGGGGVLNLFRNLGLLWKGLVLA